MHFAAKNDNIGIIKLLLENSNIDPSLKEKILQSSHRILILFFFLNKKAPNNLTQNPEIKSLLSKKKKK